MTEGTDRAEDEGTPWYENRRGTGLVLLAVILIAVAVSSSVKQGSIDAETVGAVVASIPFASVIVGWLPKPTITVPFYVYLYGIFGAVTRLLLTFVVDFNDVIRQADLDDEEQYQTVSGRELIRLELGVLAAVVLAAGVYLLAGPFVDVFVGASSPAVMAGIAYVSGFYVKRTFVALGDLAARLLGRDADSGGKDTRSRAPTEPGGKSPPERSVLIQAVKGVPAPTDESTTSDDEATDREVWYAGWRGLLLFSVGSGVAVVAMLASLRMGPAAILCPEGVCAGVPVDVYLYAFMGGLGYVFTTLFVRINRTTESLVQRAFRVPAGMVLAAGVYLLSSPALAAEGEATRAVAGLSFLVGLYLNVAIVRIDAAADRTLNRLRGTIRSRRGDRDG